MQLDHNLDYVRQFSIYKESLFSNLRSEMIEAQLSIKESDFNCRYSHCNLNTDDNILYFLSECPILIPYA